MAPRSCWILTALCLLPGCSRPAASPASEPAADQASDQTGIDPRAPDTGELDAYFQAQFPPDEPGIAVWIAQAGEPVFTGAYGLADLDTREAITTQTLFNLGSLSKTFVAHAILILRDRGELSLDDPLSKYFGEDFAHPELAEQVQLRHLLTHSSGLPDTRPVQAEPEFYLSARDAENWQPITQAEALEFEPGSRFAYSNPAFNGLALIIEQVSGRKWQDFVHDEIFVPAGMDTSTITDGPHPQSGVAHGYIEEPKGSGQWLESDYGEVPTFAAAGNGGVWSSVEELARYELALREGSFLDPASVADARTAKRFANWSSEQEPMIGWSWFIVEHEGLQEIQHTGSQGGFLTGYFVLPEAQLLIIFTMNGLGDFDGVRGAIDGWLRGQGLLRAAP